MCEGTPLHDLNLDNFSTRLDMVNKVLRGRAVTRAERHSQLNKLVELKQALGQSLEGPLNDNSSNNSIPKELRSNLQEGSYWKTNNSNRDSNRDFDGNFDLPVDAARKSSSADTSNYDFDATRDLLPILIVISILVLLPKIAKLRRTILLLISQIITYVAVLLIN